jgi:hypothetical protein
MGDVFCVSSASLAPSTVVLAALLIVMVAAAEAEGLLAAEAEGLLAAEADGEKYTLRTTVEFLYAAEISLLCPAASAT